MHPPLLFVRSLTFRVLAHDNAHSALTHSPLIHLSGYCGGAGAHRSAGRRCSRCSRRAENPSKQLHRVQLLGTGRADIAGDQPELLLAELVRQVPYAHYVYVQTCIDSAFARLERQMEAAVQTVRLHTCNDRPHFPLIRTQSRLWS